LRHCGFCLPLSCRGPGRLERRPVLEHPFPASIAGPGAHVSKTASADLQHQPGIYGIELPPDRISHFQVDLSAEDCGCADGVCRSGLADLHITGARSASVALHRGSRPPRRRNADAMAPGDWRSTGTSEMTTTRPTYWSVQRE